jgi:hypothetical protein
MLNSYVIIKYYYYYYLFDRTSDASQTSGGTYVLA